MNKPFLLFTLIVRSLLVITGLTVVASTIEIGTSLTVLSVFSIFGTAFGVLLADKKVSHIRSLAFIAALSGGLYLALSSLSLLAGSVSGGALTSYVYSLHASFIILVTSFSALTAFLFLRSPWYSSLETLVLIASLIFLFSGHREFKLNQPKFLSQIAWTLGLSELATLVTLGTAASFLALSYFFLTFRVSALTQGELFRSVFWKGNRRPLLASVITFIVTGGLLALINFSLFSYYKKESVALLSNGVGQLEEGDASPLNFQSALGASNQPAALVRLEGDYKENPHIPMLYFRESALSKIQGNELVIAGGRFDKDTPLADPAVGFASNDSSLRTGIDRVKVTQSVYLLSDHNLAFAVDYPLSISPLKNPKPERFKGAYRAVSLAPTIPLEMLPSMEAGNPEWSEEERKLYLETHPDPRYEELAQNIVQESSNPVATAFKITKYLSEKSIYTLSPGHQITQGSDQTAPYLFGDMRGYCVHFAHATVYLLRSLGIPSRIGTGYLTDLSQAKDGHILLRMSDRHAWAEVYVDGAGWVPFDTHPDQVESHAESPVDMNLLDELMGMVGPEEELVPELPANEEVREPSSGLLGSLPPLWAMVLAVAGTVIGVFYGLKAWFWYGYLLPQDPLRKLFAFNRAFSSRTSALGYRREKGETLLEYRERIEKTLDLNLFPLTPLLLQNKYGDKKITSSLPDEPQTEWKTLPLRKRVLAFLNFNLKG